MGHTTRNGLSSSGITAMQLGLTCPLATLDMPFGDTYEEKSKDTFRLAFNNINGLSLSSQSLHDFLSVTQDLQLDWIGLAETHLDSTKPHVRAQFKSAMQSPQGFPAVNCIFSASDINFGTDRKRGGVLQMSINNLATRTIASYSDPYGRFTSQTHIGKNGNLLTIITGYRVGDTSQGPASAYAQQRAMLVSQNRPAKPRALFNVDIIAYTQDCQQQGHDIVLCLDANETTTKTNSSIRKLMTTCSLVDVHEALHPSKSPPSHRSGSGKIDYILTSPRILQCVTRAGILPIDDAYGSDHRLLFIDIDIVECFQGVKKDPINPRTRSFTTKNRKQSEMFRQAIRLKWERQNFSKRIKILSELMNQPTPYPSTESQ
jgi:exonuclease III